MRLLDISVLSKELISTLDKWEQEELRDFVRRRGTPILERIPIESIEKSDDGMLDFNMLPQGGMVGNVVQWREKVSNNA